MEKAHQRSYIENSLRQSHVQLRSQATLSSQLATFFGIYPPALGGRRKHLNRSFLPKTIQLFNTLNSILLLCTVFFKHSKTTQSEDTLASACHGSIFHLAVRWASSLLTVLAVCFHVQSQNNHEITE